MVSNISLQGSASIYGEDDLNVKQNLFSGRIALVPVGWAKPIILIQPESEENGVKKGYVVHFFQREDDTGNPWQEFARWEITGERIHAIWDEKTGELKLEL